MCSRHEGTLLRQVLVLVILCRSWALDLPDVRDNPSGVHPTPRRPGALLRGVQNVVYPPIKLFREVRMHSLHPHPQLAARMHCAHTNYEQILGRMDLGAASCSQAIASRHKADRQIAAQTQG